MKKRGESGYLKDYGVQLHLVETMEDVAEFLAWLRGPRDGILCFDTETTGLRPDTDVIRLAQFGDKAHGWAIPYEKWSGMVDQVFVELKEDIGLHNAKFDSRMYTADRTEYKWPWDRTHDSMTLAHLINPLRPKGLKTGAARVVDPQAVAGQDDLSKAMREQNWTWATVPDNLPAYWIYAAMDPVLTSHYLEVLREQLEADPKMAYLYDLEMGITRIVAKMERRGIRVDPAYLEQKVQVLEDYINEASQWIADTYKIPHVTPFKLKKFFDDNGVSYMEKRTKGGGISMDKEVVESAKHPIVEPVLAIRKVERLTKFYLKVFLRDRDENDRVHANFWTMGTRTARMSITDPALQTLPKKDKTVRNAVIPADGMALISFDADQIEARLMAHFSGSVAMIEAFNRALLTGEDFFCMIASMVYRETITDKKDTRRNITKTTVYGLIYGGGEETLAHNAGVDISVMSAFLYDFHTMFPEVKSFQRELMVLAKQRGKVEGEAYVKTPLGRKMIVDDDKDYTATNYLIQSHAAEILKEKVVLLDSLLPEESHILLLVHDEVLIEMPVGMLEEWMPIINEALNYQAPGRYSVPITWGGAYSTASWGDLVD